MGLITKKGVITEIFDRHKMNVYIEDMGSTVNATISKNMKVYENKTLEIDDIVIIQISPYDLTRGRIHRDTFLNK